MLVSGGVSELVVRAHRVGPGKGEQVVRDRRVGFGMSELVERAVGCVEGWV